jgi:hypothetical protein
MRSSGNSSPPPLERTASGRRSAPRFALIVVLNGKLLEVLGDDVTQEQAGTFADGTPTTC